MIDLAYEGRSTWRAFGRNGGILQTGMAVQEISGARLGRRGSLNRQRRKPPTPESSRSSSGPSANLRNAIMVTPTNEQIIAALGFLVQPEDVVLLTAETVGCDDDDVEHKAAMLSMARVDTIRLLPEPQGVSIALEIPFEGGVSIVACYDQADGGFPFELLLSSPPGPS